MLSISSMLGPSSPVSQRAPWSSNQSERPSEGRHSSSTPDAGVMPRPRDHQGLQTLLNAATSSEPNSPQESFRSGSRMKSFGGEVVASFPQGQSSHERKRMAYDIDDEQTPSPNQGRFTVSTSPVPKKQKRAPRPQYTKEQEDFIWFCRDDLAMSWRKVVQLYNNHWHPFEVEPHIRSESGLQSRYYRILDFPVKIRKKKEPSRPDLGLIPSTQRRYPWMGVIKADIEGKKNAERNARYTVGPERSRPTMNQSRDSEEANNSGSEVGDIISEPDRTHGPKREQQWSIAGSTGFRENRGSRVILHTMETDSEVEREREYCRPSTSSSYDRYSLKSVNSDEDSQETIKTQSQPLRYMAEGPIRLPPLRRHFTNTNNTNHDRGMTDDFRKRSHEKPAAGHVCKISVINLCI